MTHRRRPPRVASSVAVALLVAASACTSDDDEAGTGSAAESKPAAWQFVTRPDLTPPKIDITTEGAAGARVAADEDLVLLAAKDGGPMNGPLIVDGQGKPVWALPLGDRWAYDLRVQRYEGEPVLTWWRGNTNPNGYGEGEYVIMDRSYQEIATVTTAGTLADIHDMVLTSRGTALMINYPTVRHDLSAVGGPRDGYLKDCEVQEVDVASGEVVFRWSALDHVPLTETMVEPAPDDEEGETGTKQGPLDPYHLNSVAEDGEGSLLVSARNTQAIYRIDRATGEVDWTLGGSGSDFEMLGDSSFAWQHDAERQADGTITLFDNQAAPPVGDESRGLRLALNRARGTARVVTEYLPPEDRLSDSQGNLEVLDNGHVFVGWGSEPFYSEYTPNGDLLYDAGFSGGISYRAFRQPWHAEPAEPPKFVLDDDTAYVSWNGATEVAAWRFLAGRNARSATQVALVDRDGFETSAPMPDRAYIAALALDSSGRVLATAVPGSWP